jgi:glyoxylase-like metal-dependent hydrolase (beta-lactamase superfamily II)
MQPEETNMELKRLTERIWYYPFEGERDRPNLGYIRGDRWSLAVDAGHSDAHVEEFYAALEREGLPLPALTVLTHWHWDHTFGLHRIHGLSLANGATNRHLRDFRQKVNEKGPQAFLSLDESIRLEYAGGRPIRIRTADLEFENALDMDAGNCPIRVFRTEAPHTDDSTLVHAVGERVLFLGDATCDSFQEGIWDAALALRLHSAIRAVDPVVCLEGHWTPVPAAEILKELAGEA